MSKFLLVVITFSSMSLLFSCDSNKSDSESSNQKKRDTVVVIQKQNSRENKVRNDLNGQLLKKPGQNKIYWIDKGRKRRIESSTILNNLFVQTNITNYRDIELLPNDKPINDNNKLMRCKSINSSIFEKVFLLDEGKKRHIVTVKAFKKYNFNWSAVNEMDCSVIESIPTGEPIK